MWDLMADPSPLRDSSSHSQLDPSERERKKRGMQMLLPRWFSLFSLLLILSSLPRRPCAAALAVEDQRGGGEGKRAVGESEAGRGEETRGSRVGGGYSALVGLFASINPEQLRQLAPLRLTSHTCTHAHMHTHTFTSTSSLHTPTSPVSTRFLHRFFLFLHTR